MNSPVAISISNKARAQNAGRWEKAFLWVACVIFGITGLAKMISATGTAEVLAVRDPVFGILFRYLLLWTGLAELLTSILCISRLKATTKITAVAFVATNIMLYRFSLLLIGYKKPCPCLGGLTDAVHISPQIADSIMKSLLLFLIVFSYLVLFKSYRNRQLEAQ